MKNIGRFFSRVIILALATWFLSPITYFSEDGHTFAVTNSKPAKVQDLRSTSVTQTSITIKWRKVSNADGYEILRNKKVIKRLKSLKYTDKKLTTGRKYSYSVRAYTNYKQRQYYNSKQKKWVNSKPKKNQWKGKKTRTITKRRYGLLSRTIKVSTKAAENPNTKKIPILTFHRIVSDECKSELYKDYQWVAAVSDFRRQMQYLHENNYKVISIQEFEDWYDHRCELPKKTVVLTFDDGDYELYYLVYPILKEFGFCATSFIVGSFTQDETNQYLDNERHYIGKDLISVLNEEYPDIQFQSHTYDLHYVTDKGHYAVDTKTYGELDDDYKKNAEFGFDYIAYPYGHYSEDMINAAKSNGIRMGFAFRRYVCATRDDDRYEIPRIKINGEITYEEYVKKLKSYLN